LLLNDELTMKARTIDGLFEVEHTYICTLQVTHMHTLYREIGCNNNNNQQQFIPIIVIIII